MLYLFPDDQWVFDLWFQTISSWEALDSFNDHMTGFTEHLLGYCPVENITQYLNPLQCCVLLSENIYR